jgi:predicted alpha/beta hydrolase family esterase
MKSWRQPVLQKLPFPSICVASSDDPFCALPVAKRMAGAWGSDWVEIGAKGHINADSGLGAWPQGRELLTRWNA